MRQVQEAQKDHLLLCLLCPPGLPVSLPQAEQQHQQARNETPPVPKNEVFILLLFLLEVATIEPSLHRAQDKYHGLSAGQRERKHLCGICSSGWTVWRTCCCVLELIAGMSQHF